MSFLTCGSSPVLQKKKKKYPPNPCHLAFLCFRACPELLGALWQLGANLSLETLLQTWCFCGVLPTHNFLLIVPLAFSGIQAEQVSPVHFCYFKPCSCPSQGSFPVLFLLVAPVWSLLGGSHPSHPSCLMLSSGLANSRASSALFLCLKNNNTREL